MASRDDWYRSEAWEDEDKLLFESKLKRARGNFKKAQYVKIKAIYMARSEKAETRQAARELFKRVIVEYPDQVGQVKLSYEYLGTSYKEDGFLSEAEKMYRTAIKIHNTSEKGKAWHIHSEFLLGELLVLVDDSEKNKEAELIFNELATREHYFIFNDQIFRYYLARARLAKKLEKYDEASNFARHALETAKKGQTPQFSRHKDVGLVIRDDEVIKELNLLANMDKGINTN